MDFEAMIRTELAQGSSMEDIAKKVGGIMNSIQDEEKAKVNKRQEYIDEIEKVFWTNAKSDCFGIKDVSALALLVVQKEHPNWTTEDMDEFCATVEKNVKLQADVQGKKPGEVISIAMKHIANEVESKGKNDRETIEEFLNRL